MARVIDLGSAKPTDPIYSGGHEMFSPRAFRPSSPSTPPTSGGAIPESPPASPPESTPKREDE